MDEQGLRVLGEIPVEQLEMEAAERLDEARRDLGSYERRAVAPRRDTAPATTGPRHTNQRLLRRTARHLTDSPAAQDRADGVQDVVGTAKSRRPRQRPEKDRAQGPGLATHDCPLARRSRGAADATDRANAAAPPVIVRRSGDEAIE